MPKFHKVWVSSLGAMFIEEAQTYKDAATAANAAAKESSADDGTFRPFRLTTIDGVEIGIHGLDHFRIITPDEIIETKTGEADVPAHGTDG